MHLSNYLIVYLVSNIFGTYTIFKFMTIFFPRDKNNKIIELISYIIYFLSISLIYIFFDKPILNLVSNLVFFYLLTFNYKASWKSRFSAVVYIYSILVCAETFTVILIKILYASNFAKNSGMELIYIQIFDKIISYIVVLAVSNFKMLKTKNNISSLHWAAIFFIPLGSLFSATALISQSELNNISILISIVILFTTNVFVFYLYDVLMQYYKEIIDKELLLLQNNAYTKQLNIMKQSQENLSILRHDFKFHISSLQAMLEKREIDKAQKYLKVFLNTLKHSDEYAKSGNSEVDSILNYKINEAVNRNIEVKLNLNIPIKLNIKPFDLVAVLGNLLDNAIESTSKMNDERIIKADIRFDRGVLYINLINPFSELLVNNNKLLTTNIDKKSHGHGLESVKRTVEKYNGTLEIRYSDNIFYIDALLYNPPDEDMIF